MRRACINGNAIIVSELINAGATAHLNPDGEFFTIAISRRGCKNDSKQPVIDVLLNANAVMNPNDWLFWTSIGSSGAHAFAKQCLDRWEPDVGCLSDCLFRACEVNDVDMIKCLCEYSDVHKPDLIKYQFKYIVNIFFCNKGMFTDTSGIDYFLTRYGHLYDDLTALMFDASAANSVNMLTGYLASRKCDVTIRLS
jgi:hypothetical protein